jgi:predicted O-linked N-acetylglucosamine transferase (SPINDLY family)
MTPRLMKDGAFAIVIPVSQSEQAITLRQAFDLALRRHQAGQLREAGAIYRQILRQHPDHVDAMHLLGVIAHQTGQNAAAVELIGKAIGLNPNLAEAHVNLGMALKAGGRLDDAIAAYRRAIALRPGYAEAHGNLGSALREKGQLDAALECYRQAVSLNPNLPGGHSNLANVLHETGRLDEAVAAYRQAIAQRPAHAESRVGLGNALRDQGELDEAIAMYRQAVALRPGYAPAHGNLGSALIDRGELQEALAACRQAIALDANLPEAHLYLGNALVTIGQPDEAISAFRQAICLKPGFAHAHANLGSALKDIGRLDDAIAAFRQAVALQPGYIGAYSNILYTLYFHPAFDAQSIAAEHRQWNLRHAQPLARLIPAHANIRDPHRRLRIGYVSPDFRNHCQSLFSVALLSHHDHQQFEIFCYSSVARPDDITLRLEKCADVWRPVSGMSDATVAGLIAADQIDILVDLTMHMSGGRPLLFAQKSAPLQLAWLAYPGTTGMPQIDYRLTDPYLDPPGVGDEHYAEKSIRLPDSFWCYNPLTTDPPVNPLPALSSDGFTFGCLNNFCKINDDVLKLWSMVLRKVENSRLLLLAPVGSARDRILDCFGQNGIDPNRIEFVAKQSRQKYLETYHQVDLGLDTFPANGHTTSLDSLWMGVPVVTLVGRIAIARAGWCHLSNLELSELAAHTPDQFVQIAANLARDLPRLQHLRSTLRRRMEQSPLMDAPKFARNVEAAYRRIWQAWCEAAK